MKVYLVWYIDPYNPVTDVIKVFDSERKAEEHINLLDNKEDFTIEEIEVE